MIVEMSELKCGLQTCLICRMANLLYTIDRRFYSLTVSIQTFENLYKSAIRYYLIRFAVF
jgi:hypothetical protein